MTWRIVHSDCVEAMAAMPAESVDAIVTDPPYLLGFMGKHWDKGDADFHHAWARQAFRLLKPGGHLVAFGGTRTYHRMACAIEDAGFEIRDSLHWLYGSGFPKSLDVSKSLDAHLGAERPACGWREDGCAPGDGNATTISAARARGFPATAPATDEAARWSGWGTALKPAHEPCVLARKPLAGTVAENVLAHGTGALNIEVCRVGWTDEADKKLGRPSSFSGARESFTGPGSPGTFAVRDRSGEDPVSAQSPAGRWPPNLLLTHAAECVQVGTRKVRTSTAVGGSSPMAIFGGFMARTADAEDCGFADADGTETIPAWNCAHGCPVAELDQQSGELTSGVLRAGQQRKASKGGGYGGGFPDTATLRDYGGDTGCASRFFPVSCWDPDLDVPFRYVAKAARGERDAGLHDLDAATGGEATDREDGSDGLKSPRAGAGRTGGARNVHPTVKPIELMEWLVRLVTPPGGTVLDPFLGSGSTGAAAVRLGFDFVGIEREAEYVAIAERRIRLAAAAPRSKSIAALERVGDADPRQVSLFEARSAEGEG